MAAPYDPNIELQPGKIILAGIILVALALGAVWFITIGDAMLNDGKPSLGQKR